jgi:chromosome partitioning protein
VARIIAIANQKGGVGKTTTCVNLAASLAAMRKRVLLVDLDPQGNATTGCGLDKSTLQHSAYDVLTSPETIHQAVVKLDNVDFSLLPANGDLTAAEVELMSTTGRERRLRAALGEIQHSFDHVLIDCPPSLNLLTLNGLVAADSVIIAMQCEFFALEGMSALLDTIEQVRGSVNAGLELEGILRTMYDPRNSLTNAVSAQLHEHFGEQVYRTVIPRNIRLAEAPSHGLPAMHYDRSSRGSRAYMALAGELIRREERAAQQGSAQHGS